MELDLNNYTYETRYPRTLNECINDLVKGHAGVVLPCDLEKHFVELVQDECLFRYPLIRYMYAHILWLGYWVADDYRQQCCITRGEDPELAKEILMPLAEEGLAPAQYDIAVRFCFSVEEQAIWILKASKQNYIPAIERLNQYLALGTREKLSTETLKEVCWEVVRTYEGKYSGEFALKLLENLSKKKMKIHTESEGEF